MKLRIHQLNVEGEVAAGEHMCIAHQSGRGGALLMAPRSLQRHTKSYPRQTATTLLLWEVRPRSFTEKVRYLSQHIRAEHGRGGGLQGQNACRKC